MKHTSLLPLLDTHQHLIYPEHSKYNWTRELPALADRAFRLDDYLKSCAGTGIVRSIFMETSPDDWEQENGWISPLMDKGDSPIAGIISNCRPERDDFEKWLAESISPQIVGLRRICHVEPDAFSQQPRFIASVEQTGRAGLAFDLIFRTDQLQIAFDLAARCPEVRFVLDHCGLNQFRPDLFEDWRTGIRRLATLPNVSCKISGVLVYSGEAEPCADAARPYVLHALDCFGPRRLVWGSDWPVVNVASDLATWVRISRELIYELSESEQRDILYRNAVSIYRLNAT